jgi:anti-anti-sigma factor
MLRITMLTAAPDATLKLEGRIAGESVEELRRLCERVFAGTGGGRLILDLTSVSFIDSEGIEFFCTLQRRNVLLTGCSPFVGELLKEGWSC